MSLTITTLIEDSNLLNEKLEFEHGLSFFIEHDDKKILFDTGSPGGKFLINAERLNVDLSHIDYMVLSHGHYDHTGGVTDYINKYGSDFTLVVHPSVFSRRVAIEKGKEREIGNAFTEESLKQKNVTIQHVLKPMSLSPSVHVVTDFELMPEYPREHTDLRVEEKGELHVDHMPGEVVIVLNHPEGLVIIAGCSHIGVVSIIEKIRNTYGQRIYAFIGGTHLLGETENYLEKTLDYFEKSDMHKIGVCHCTGEKAEKRFAEKLGSRFFKVTTGSVIQL